MVSYLVEISIGITVDADSPDDAEFKAKDIYYKCKVPSDYEEISCVEELDEAKS
jgi:hypothetical protein